MQASKRHHRAAREHQAAGKPVAVCLLLLTAPVGASVDDGIRLFFDGDYPAAVAELEASGAGDPVAQLYLGMIHDRHFHTLWAFENAEGGFPVYSAGVGSDTEAMLAGYGAAILAGNMIARFRYCDWVAGPLFVKGSYLRDSQCRRLWPDFKKYWLANPDDPEIAYYAWVAGSGEIGTKQRRQAAIALLTPAAAGGDRRMQYYLGLVHLGYNPRHDRPADYVQAYGSLAASAIQGNYHARVYYTFTRQILQANGGLDEAEAFAATLLH